MPEQNAARYIMSGETKKGHTVTIKAENGVRYTVPQSIDIGAMADRLTVRFRVADVYKGRSICVYYDGTCISRRKKKVLAPGEMEQVIPDKGKPGTVSGSERDNHLHGGG